MSRLDSKGQRLVALCMLGGAVQLPDSRAVQRVRHVFGVPVLYAYIFIAWAALIALMALVAESPGLTPTAPREARMLHGTDHHPGSFAYLGLLFAIAYYADKRADAGRSIIASPYIYSLSLAVYATAWTFYGSVGRAASDGVGFLPIYIGPTLMIALWWVVMRKILRISKANRITSLADFIASRYGKSALLGGLVTIIAVIGILPYISLQLKAVSNSFTILVQYPEIIMPAQRRRRRRSARTRRCGWR